jgi:hypothetical protein
MRISDIFNIIKLNNGMCEIIVRKSRLSEFQNIVDKLFSGCDIQFDYDFTKDSTDNVNI